jgi:hypothetical protein
MLILASGNVVHDLRRLDVRKRDEPFDWTRRPTTRRVLPGGIPLATPRVLRRDVIAEVLLT